VFDWAGNLALAAQCAALAGTIATYQTERVHLATTALDQWSGVFAQNFSDRINVSSRTAAELESTLRNTAGLYAGAWQHAATQNQYNLWAEYCQKLDDKRSTLTKAWDWLAGDDTKFPPQPPDAPMPEGPDYLAPMDPTVYTPPSSFSPN
jgi:hypothetical protein